jgi:hypothetical protein
VTKTPAPVPGLDVAVDEEAELVLVAVGAGAALEPLEIICARRLPIDGAVAEIVAKSPTPRIAHCNDGSSFIDRS